MTTRVQASGNTGHDILWRRRTGWDRKQMAFTFQASRASYGEGRDAYLLSSQFWAQVLQRRSVFKRSREAKGRGFSTSHVRMGKKTTSQNAFSIPRARPSKGGTWVVLPGCQMCGRASHNLSHTRGHVPRHGSSLRGHPSGGRGALKSQSLGQPAEAGNKWGQQPEFRACTELIRSRCTPTHQTEMEPSPQTTSSSATEVRTYASRAPRDMGLLCLRN